jgi:uncharacterized protein YlxW (UPF0749 family)
MQERKRNNLVILALAGSILASAILVSMNQVNSARLRNPTPTATDQPSSVGSSSADYVKLQNQINDLQSRLNSFTECSDRNFSSLSFWVNFENQKPIIVRCN